MINYIHIIVTLIAGIIYTMMAIILRISVIKWSYNLIIILLIFLALGSLYKRYLIKNIFNDKILDNEEEVIEEEIDDTTTDDVINIDENEQSENENFFESLGEE